MALTGVFFIISFKIEIFAKRGHVAVVDEDQLYVQIFFFIACNLYNSSFSPKS